MVSSPNVAAAIRKIPLMQAGLWFSKFVVGSIASDSIYR